ncbi:hypothetical protein GGR52DRAFT_555664 [Hypoxylon sp. FL1284]|nr:hypothetical protein GGR52DRAFT_555664 [Hypoxylon sp. FL1284]
MRPERSRNYNNLILPFTMSSATESKKSQPSPISTASSMLKEENTGSNANTKQKDRKRYISEELDTLFRESRERVAAMSPEESAKAFPWMEQLKHVTPTPASEVPDEVWDQI